MAERFADSVKSIISEKTICPQKIQLKMSRFSCIFVAFSVR